MRNVLEIKPDFRDKKGPPVNIYYDFFLCSYKFLELNYEKDVQKNARMVDKCIKKN